MQEDLPNFAYLLYIFMFSFTYILGVEHVFYHLFYFNLYFVQTYLYIVGKCIYVNQVPVNLNVLGVLFCS